MARSKTPPVKIIIDVHERQSGIADTLAELGAEIEMAQLPAGDYAVGATTLVERKRVLDLTPLSSRAASGRSSASFAQPVPFPTSSLQRLAGRNECHRSSRPRKARALAFAAHGREDRKIDRRVLYGKRG